MTDAARSAASGPGGSGEPLDSDEELVRRMASGEERALAALYDRYGGLVYSLAHAIVREGADAEEVTVDVFSQLWRTADRFDAERGAVRTWLATIGRSRALDLVRSRGRRQGAYERSAAADAAGLASPPPSRPRSPDEQVEQDEMRETVSGALHALPEAQREVIELAYFQGLSQSEIAAHLNEPLGTVKTRTRTALQRLRDALVAPSGRRS